MGRIPRASPIRSMKPAHSSSLSPTAAMWAPSPGWSCQSATLPSTWPHLSGISPPNRPYRTCAAHHSNPLLLLIVRFPYRLPPLLQSHASYVHATSGCLAPLTPSLRPAQPAPAVAPAMQWTSSSAPSRAASPMSPPLLAPMHACSSWRRLAPIRARVAT
jgi:hypothetical protein